MSCPERVGKGVVTYPCTLDVGHDGPHASAESVPSQNARRRWEESTRLEQITLAEFQGPAQTTAQRYTENPTRPPLSPGRRSLHSGCQPWECEVYDGQGDQRRSARDECPYYDGSLPPTVGDPEKGTEVGKATRTTPEDEVAFEGGEVPLRSCCNTYQSDRHSIECPQVRQAVAKMQEEASNRCGAHWTLGHGNDAVCGLHRGHDGNHLDSTYSETEGFAWYAGGAILKAPAPTGKPLRQPTRTRKEDQVLPTGDESIADDQSLIIADIEKRRQVGIERYGQGHRPFNGRNTILDGYEEILDLLVYWRSLLRTREAKREELIEVVHDALVANSIATYGIDHPEMDKQTAAEIAVDRILDAIVVWEVTGG